MELLSLLCPINGTVPSLERKQLTARYLECGLYCGALNKSEVGRRPAIKINGRTGWPAVAL